MKKTEAEELPLIDPVKLRELPCQDFKIIERLWRILSNNHFGVSRQVQIWKKLGGQTSSSDHSVNAKFDEQVGWSKDQTWNELTFTLDSPKGHLPSYCTPCPQSNGYTIWAFGSGGNARAVEYLARKMEECLPDERDNPYIWWKDL